MNKQKALERLREIEKEIKELEWNKFDTRRLIKEAQKIKDDWEEGCGISEMNENERSWGICGCFSYICPACKKQNKEKEEICGRIFG